MGKKRFMRRANVLLATGVVLVAGVLLWYLSHAMVVRTSCGPPRCALNLRQLMSAIVAYQGDEESMPVALDAKRSARDANEAREVTYRSFQLLAARMQLPNSVFDCAAAKRSVPWTRRGSPATFPYDAHYAYDWAAPEESASWRIILSVRSLQIHKRLVLAAAADSSVRWLKPSGIATAGHRTRDADGEPVTAVVGNPDAGDDTIFDDVGDDEGGQYDALSPKRGSPSRAWVK